MFTSLVLFVNVPENEFVGREKANCLSLSIHVWIYKSWFWNLF